MYSCKYPCFRTQVMETSGRQVGQQLLRECIFIHLDNPADKLALLLAMLQKLYALVAGQAAEDNPDALTHHEIMLPGQLLSKFIQDKLLEALAIFKEMVCSLCNIHSPNRSYVPIHSAI